MPWCGAWPPRSGVEAVPHPADRLEVARVLGVVADVRAQAGDEVVHRARRPEVAGAPHRLHELLAGEDAVRVRDEPREQVELAARELEDVAGRGRLARVEVELDVPR